MANGKWQVAESGGGADCNHTYSVVDSGACVKRETWSAGPKYTAYWVDEALGSCFRDRACSGYITGRHGPNG